MERSKAGIAMRRHADAAHGAPPPPDPGLWAALEAHVERHWGSPSLVWMPEEGSPIGVAIVAPDAARPALTLVTMGMSLRGMPSPAGSGESGTGHCELLMHLPPSWPQPGDPELATDERVWPLELLYDLAALPFRFDTTVWLGDTVANGDPPRPYAAGTDLCGALVGPMITAPSEAATVLEYRDRTVSFFGAWLLYASELRFKLERGTEALFDALDDARVLEALTPGRAPAVAA